MSMNNPYAWNAVDPDLCYGRDSLLTDLLNGLAENPRYSYGLAGGRRMGKTTVLRRVERDLAIRGFLTAVSEICFEDGMLVTVCWMMLRGGTRYMIPSCTLVWL